MSAAAGAVNGGCRLNVEVDIQRRTALGERTPCTTLLPSLILQSINI